MKDQVLSIQQMQHLKELGVDTSKASMCYVKKHNGTHLVVNESCYYEMPAFKPILCFTLQDMLEMMPSALYAWKDGEVSTQSDSCDYKAYLILRKQRIGYTCEYKDIRHDMPIFQEDGDTSVEATYYMMCLLAENKLLGKEEKHG